MLKPAQRTASAIISNPERTQVLLIKREDFRVWVLPAGGVDPGEDWPAAAIREAREESGLIIELDALVGEYMRPQFNELVRVYAAHAVGGSTDDHGWEAVDVRWFPLDALPRSFSAMHRTFLEDWLAGDYPVKREQRVAWWFATLLHVLIFFRNIRNRILGLP